jgi:acetyl esterase/lipase
LPPARAPARSGLRRQDDAPPAEALPTGRTSEPFSPMHAAPLWPTDAPGALGSGRDHAPHLTPFAAARATASASPVDASVLVLPGGGYWMHADHEGAGYARWFAERGIHAEVLDYRLAKNGYRHPHMLQDAARALRTLRAAARAAGRDPARIAVIGSSAGGHLAATLSTLFAHADASDPVGDEIGRESARPDATILCYPVVTLTESFRHGGSRDNLLGPGPDPELAALLSPERQVRADCPPAFVWHTADDSVVPVANSTAYAAACWGAGVPCELHVFSRGRHGLGLGRPDEAAPPWDRLLEHWLAQLGWL